MLRIFRCITIGFIVACLSLSSYAAVNQIEEEDGSPSKFPWKIIVPNVSLTDNGDGTVALSYITPTVAESTYLRLDFENADSAPTGTGFYKVSDSETRLYVDGAHIHTWIVTGNNFVFVDGNNFIFVDGNNFIFN